MKIFNSPHNVGIFISLEMVDVYLPKMFSFMYFSLAYMYHL